VQKSMTGELTRSQYSLRTDLQISRPESVHGYEDRTLLCIKSQVCFVLFIFITITAKIL
jgi:hypothetical protein